MKEIFNIVEVNMGAIKNLSLELVKNMTEEEIKETISQLQEELVRKTTPIPKPLKSINTKEIVKFCEEVVECVSNEGYYSDLDHYSFETLFSAVYGEKFWKWYNKNYTGA
jgi:hypothetical protein